MNAGDEAGEGAGARDDARELDGLVDAVDVAHPRPVAERRECELVEVMARVRGRRLAVRGGPRAVHRLVRIRDHLHERVSRVELVADGAEATEADVRAQALRPRRRRRGGGDRRAHRTLGRVRLPVGREPHAHAEPGADGSAGAPVTALDRADVDDAARLVRRAAAVELLLERPQAGREREAGEDRVRAGVRLVRVARATGDGDVAPEHSGTAEQEVEAGRLGQQHRVAEHAGADRRKRAVAGALLLDRADEDE